ncbi:MAG TPA: diguanylate cyclase [Candidatus Polarisedimenticolia bacterium]|nr:diguanylate cyclase [Candidatus Polarisedimenticolia bacterium]
MATILLVDDEEVNLYALKIILEARQYRCFTASNGPDALRVAHDTLPDAILLDIHMPVMDGFEVCRRLKEDPRTSPIPIVFLTARHRDQEEIIRGLDLGANDYITKPFNPEELIARVAVMVRVRTAEDALRHASYTDDLTGLYNRRFLQQRLEEEIHRASRYLLRLSCIMLDIDHFKSINDTHGHSAGDAVLKEVATVMKRHVRRSDLAIRYGGEEFMLILFESDKLQAHRVAERIRLDVESSRIDWKGQPLSLTISIGVSSFPDPGITTPDELIARADSALYSAKASGRNMVQVG